MAIYRLGEGSGLRSPKIALTAFVADDSHVIGDVSIGERVSVWFGAVLRGDSGAIRIGAGSNIQDGAILHSSPGQDLDVGVDVTVGHQAVLHGCTIGDGCLIGIQAVVLDGAVIGRGSLVAAGALVTAGSEFPARSLIMGSPARLVRELLPDQQLRVADNAARYVKQTRIYRDTLERIDVCAVEPQW